MSEPSAVSDRHHPFAALRTLQARLQPRPPEPPAPTRLEELVDAPYETFELDSNGVIHAESIALGHLTTGASIALPEVKLAELEGIPAGTRSQLQRRLLAYARDVLGRLLAPLDDLSRSERAPLRAIAYQLAQGLGSARRGDLASTIRALSDDDRDALNSSVVEPGRLAIFIPGLLGGHALSRRLTFVRAHQPALKLPPQVGRPVFDAQSVPDRLWLTLGYVVLGRRALRLDLAERVAALFAEGSTERDALQCLALPKRDWAAVSASFRSLQQGRG